MTSARTPRKISSLEVARALGIALELRGLEPVGHADRLAALSEQLGQALGLQPRELEAVRFGAYLHDLGRFALPEALSLHSGPLDEHQWALMRQHPTLGLEQAASLPGVPPAALELIAAHHERWDGTGYPRNLGGQAIPLAARIFAVADAYTAMTANWWRGRAISPDAALYQLALESGNAFDPRVVEALTDALGFNLPAITQPRPVPVRSLPETATDASPPSRLPRFALCDHKGKLVYTSPRYQAALGLDGREPRTRNLIAHVHPDDRAAFEDAMLETAETGRRSPLVNARWGKTPHWSAMRFSFALVPGSKGASGLVFVWLEEASAPAASRNDAQTLGLLGQAVASSNAAILVTDAHERIVDASPAFLRQTGYALPDVLGRTPRILHGPKTSRVGRDLLRRGIQQAQPCQAELINYRKDGSEFWVQINIDPVFGPDGTPTHFVSVQQDTTELRRAQAEEHRLLEVTQDAILIVDEHGLVAQLNPRAEVVLEGAAAGRPLAELFHPSDARAVRAALETARCGQVAAGLETRGRDLDGWGRWMSWTPTAFPGEQRTYWVGHEVTARKLAEASLKKSEERHRAVVAALAEGVILQDREGRIITANESAERILGMPADAPWGGGTPEPLWQAIREDGSTWPRDERPGLVAARTGQAQRDIIIGIVKPEGTTWLSMNAQPLTMPGSGVPYGAVISFFDISERRRAQHALLESNERYRHLSIASQRQARELELLDRVRTALALELEISGIARAVTQTITEALGYELVSIYTVMDGVLALESAIGYETRLERLPLDQGVTGRVARNGRSELVEDAATDPDFISPIPGVQSIISVPLLDRGTVVGVLNVESLDQHRLTEDDHRLVVAVAEHVNLALSRSTLHREVQQSERKYREVVEHVHDVIAQTNASGRISFVNPAWTDITGWSIAQTIGRTSAEFIHPSDRERHQTHLNALIAQRAPSARYELRMLTRDGGFRWVSGTTSFVYDPVGALIASSSTMSDITDLHAAEITRHLSEREDGELYATTDLQHALEALARYLGAESAFVRGRTSPHAAAIIHLETTPDAAIERALEQGEANWDGSLGLVLRLSDDGAGHDTSVGTIGLRWTNTSSTERAMLRSFIPAFTAALRRAQAHQSLLEAERASNQLLEATLWAQEAERERIALGLHDGPAQAMVSAMRYIEAIQAMPVGQDTTASRHLERGVRLVGEAIRQLRETINDLIPPDLELLGLKGTITERLEQAAREEGWAVDAHLENLRLSREAEVTIYRIFTEALTNVRRHARTPKVAVRLTRQHERVIFEVRDWGVGFDLAHTHRKDDGGVGTISMKKRAELIGCDFTLESRVGHGTTVRVTLNQEVPDAVAV